MFGMSLGEILIIAVIAILFLGPEKLPGAMVKVAKFFKSFSKTINQAKDTIEQELHIEELKSEGITYKKQFSNAANEIKESANLDLIEETKPKKKKKKKKSKGDKNV